MTRQPSSRCSWPTPMARGPARSTPPTESLDWFDWSPDGTRVAYMATAELWVVDVDGGGAPRRLEGYRTGALPDVASAGRQRHRLQRGEREPRDLCDRRRRDGREAPPAVDDGREQSSSTSRRSPLSPDGAHVTFTRWSAAESPAGLRVGHRDRGGDVVPDGGRNGSARYGDLLARRDARGLCPGLW